MDISQLQIDDESMRFIVFGLARETHDFALSCGIPSKSIDDHLPLVFCILNSQASDLLNVCYVPASNASDIAGIRITFSDEGYALVVNTAKDRVANVVY